MRRRRGGRLRIAGRSLRFGEYWRLNAAIRRPH
jgi:hypothetical protein